LRNPCVEWKYEYQSLARHHKTETEFLINKCRELALKLINKENEKTYSEIIEVLDEHCEDIYQFINEDYEPIIDELLGKWTEIWVSGGCDKGSDWVRVYHFQDHDVYIEVNGYYTSYNGVEFDSNSWTGSDVKEVRPKEVIKVIYQ